jgi:hypothetical protein
MSSYLIGLQTNLTYQISFYLAVGHSFNNPTSSQLTIYFNDNQFLYQSSPNIAGTWTYHNTPLFYPNTQCGNLTFIVTTTSAGNQAVLITSIAILQIN